MRFPLIIASDLEGRRYELPDELPSGPRVLVVAFQRWHQILVNGWQPGLERIVASRPDATLWEVPALSRLYAAARPYIDGGMRSGIPDPGARQHTLTTYTDLRAFTTALDLPSLETIYVLLLDAQGEVVWLGGGEVDDRQLAQLGARLEALPRGADVTP